MALKEFYLAADGTAGGAATSWATRTNSKTQIQAVITANTTAADDVILWCSGLICREVASWNGVVSGYMLDLTTAILPGKSFRLASYKSVDSGQPAPIFCDFYLYGTSTASWTDTGTTTTRGTKIWVSAALTGVANGMGRVWGANYKTDTEFWTKEIWEGGNNYSATLGPAIHQNLDIIAGANKAGCCYTLYDSAGVLGTVMYIACPVNPWTMYGALTLHTRGTAGILAFTSIPGLVIDPDVELWGGGVITLNIKGPSPNTIPYRIEPKIRFTNPYCNPIRFQFALSNVYVAPYVDPGYNGRLPYYHAGGTGHDVSGNEISVYNNCDTSAATGWPEQGKIPGIVFTGKASNGRVSQIKDLFHSGIVAATPSVADTHKFIRVDDGVTFVSSNAQYGTPLSFLSATLTHIANATVRVCPSSCLTVLGTANSRVRISGGSYETAPNSGDRSVVGNPWGDGEDKLDTSVGIAVRTQAGYPTGEVLIEDATLCCHDGGVTVSVLDAVSFGGKIRVMNCVFVRSAIDASRPFPATVKDGVAIKLYGDTYESLAAQVEFINCVAIGFGALPVKYILKLPSLTQTAQSLVAMTVGVNTGWTLFNTMSEFQQAKASGQLPHIVA